MHSPLLCDRRPSKATRRQLVRKQTTLTRSSKISSIKKSSRRLRPGRGAHLHPTNEEDLKATLTNKLKKCIHHERLSIFLSCSVKAKCFKHYADRHFEMLSKFLSKIIIYESSRSAAPCTYSCRRESASSVCAIHKRRSSKVHMAFSVLLSLIHVEFRSRTFRNPKSF